MNFRLSGLATFFATVLFFASATHVNAQEAKVTIQKSGISLKEAFNEIEKQTNYTIAYKKSVVNQEAKISISIKNIELKEALDAILKGSGLTYKISGYHIILYKKKEAVKNVNAYTQTIRGTVMDVSTGQPIAFANVSLLNSPTVGTITDSLGHFAIKGNPLGYVNIKVSFVGYEPYEYRDILLTSAKEAVLEIPLKECSQSVDEVIVKPKVNKEQAMNPMALAEGRMISVEEANRFAGAFNDPARLVNSFAGVSGTGGISSNALSIRGNAPQYTQWRLEGVEIPNPTHFADMISLGGGVYSALSSQVMGNSDFYNGAFPAEYSNALSGAFDMRMRNGNAQKQENTFQLSLIGIDLASEGPLSKMNNSSYLFNYRYSVTGLVADADLKYQDLSFKINLPSKKAGTFSLWGLGLIDRNNVGASDEEDWETYDDRQVVDTRLEKACAGLTHKYYFNKTTAVNTTLAATYSGILQDVDQLNTGNTSTQVVDITNKNWDIVLNSYVNKKFSPKHTNRTGFTATSMIYDLDYNVSPNYGLDEPAENVAKGSGSNLALSAYTQSVFTLTPVLSLSAGANLNYFNLNDNLSFEPRVSMKWNFTPNQFVSASYGLSSRRERLDFYYVTDSVGQYGNKKLDLTKAHQFNLGYDWHISDDLHFKVEPYFQYLFDVPVEAGTSFSVLNLEDYYLDCILENSGEGKNYGVDLTLERYMKKGAYYMLTGSVFKSKYKGGDGVWRSTRYDRGYCVNGVWGKEWPAGKTRNNRFGLNLRFTFQGGERYTPINETLSAENHEIVYDDTKAFSKQYNPFINGDVTVLYRINRPKVSHEFAFKGLNLGMYTGQTGYYYNESTSSIEKGDVMGALFDVCYKIHF
jgi:hypothetical protein